ncbi:BspA family leucine-rich repeat surface protein [Lactococcus petauri]|uniref:BspA family leucine-rich repeat surface protein n=1 Tax=Lactococcus petauri TaxID=1940789 RepID=UPI00254DF701|nr:BspA family leucine-rich repeat surface protein [Lactococcus petauri]
MKKNNHKFKKTYLIFFISTFILGNILPGINSTIVANTNELIETSNENDNEIKSQTDSSNEEIDLEPNKQAEENERQELDLDPNDIDNEHFDSPKQIIEQKEVKQSSTRLEEKNIASGIESGILWYIDAEGTFVIEGDNKSIIKPGKDYGWFAYRKQINKIIIATPFRGTDLSNIFYGLSNVTEIVGSNKINASETTLLYSAFASMDSLKELDLSMWNSSKVIDMKGLLAYNNELETLDLSNNFDMSKVTSSHSMFTGTTSLKQLKLGPKVKFSGNEMLPEIVANDIYTGKWVNVGKGTLNSPEASKHWTSAELLANYDGSKDADTYVWEKKLQLDVQTKRTDIPLGTNVSDIDLNDFIESVKLNDVVLSKDEYTLELKNSIKTTKIDNQNVEIEVSLKEDSHKVAEVTSTANIVWGSTLVVKDKSLTSTDVSISLLHNNGKPYLNSNEGSGFATEPGTLTSRPIVDIYRYNDENQLVRAHYNTVYTSQEELSQKWNGLFTKTALNYGDVLTLEVMKSSPMVSWNGNNTFISRNNTLLTETVGYDYAYYELTTSGYRLLRLNQLMVNNDQKVKLNTSKEEMNKNISDYISLPEQIEKPSNYRMEFESVDTASPGNKKSIINVYESLDSGGEFKTTYDVAYTVYPEITEFYYDVDGKQIEQSQTTEFEYGKEFAPSPEKYIENNGVLYIYKGWVDALPGTGAIIPQEGIPAPTLVEKNHDYYYIYDKADKFINVTLPTEVVFGTFENNNKISSKAYEIKNNSDEIPIEISLEQFDKVTSDIKLLSSNTPDPTQEEASAKLNLYVDNKSVIPGLTEDTPRQTITKIDTNTSRAISLEGTYFGNMSEKNILDYKMHLRFKATKDNKN